MSDVIERRFDDRKVAGIDAALEKVCEAIGEARAQGDSRRERECLKLVDSWLDRRNQLAGTATCL